MADVMTNQGGPADCTGFCAAWQRAVFLSDLYVLLSAAERVEATPSWGSNCNQPHQQVTSMMSCLCLFKGALISDGVICGRKGLDSRQCVIVHFLRKHEQIDFCWWHPAVYPVLPPDDLTQGEPWWADETGRHTSSCTCDVGLSEVSSGVWPMCEFHWDLRAICNDSQTKHLNGSTFTTSKWG